MIHSRFVALLAKLFEALQQVSNISNQTSRVVRFNAVDFDIDSFISYDYHKFYINAVHFHK